jgi:hypothetical protein
MQRTPIFPVPGSGRFLRQPLFAAEFCDIIVSSILTEKTGAYNITGQQRIDYIDLIRAVKQATGARTRIQRIPYSLFWALLRVNALFDSDPAFTVGQLKALVTPDIFEVSIGLESLALLPRRCSKRWILLSGIPPTPV